MNNEKENYRGCDELLRDKTHKIKALRADAELCLLRARSTDAEDSCKRVYEALCYSDPVSCYEALEADEQLAIRLGMLSEALEQGDFELASATARDLLLEISARNSLVARVKKI